MHQRLPVDHFVNHHECSFRGSRLNAGADGDSANGDGAVGTATIEVLLHVHGKGSVTGE